MKNKFLKPVLALVLVAAMAVGGSLAYINANTEEINNKFVYAYADEDLDNVLAVDVEETFTGADGVEADVEDNGGNETAIAAFIPGTTLTKDATVTASTLLEEGARVYLKVNTDEMSDDFDVSGLVVDTSVWTKVKGYTDLYVAIENVEKTDTAYAKNVFGDNNKIVAKTDINTTADFSADVIVIDAYAIQDANITDEAALAAAVAALGATAE